MPVVSEEYATYCGSSHGPTFGSGHDVFVSDLANGTNQNYTNFAGYQLPAGASAQTFFTGAHSFQAAEVEVLYVLA